MEHFKYFCSSKTLIASFYTSQASTDQPLFFKSFIMASHQSVVNINIIMKFPIGQRVFVLLCTMSHCVLLSLKAPLHGTIYPSIIRQFMKSSEKSYVWREIWQNFWSWRLAWDLKGFHSIYRLRFVCFDKLFRV